MAWKRRLSRHLTWLSVAWLVFTLSLVGWWWFHAVERGDVEERVRRMFFWEGSFLFTVLFVGGAFLVYLTFHHQQRHERLQIFFSTFAHDLKTSMTRLRLQAELLEESKTGLDPKVRSMLKDIQKLDLQLENSLWMSQLESGHLLMQKTRLREVMDHLRNEFGEIRLEMNSDAEVIVDRRAFIVVLRNLFHNSLLHGRADTIEIVVRENGDGSVTLEVGDNGEGLKIPAANLGSDVLTTGRRNSTGLGLYLSRRLLERMDGRLDFRVDSRFVNVMTLRGRSA